MIRVKHEHRIGGIPANRMELEGGVRAFLCNICGERILVLVVASESVVVR